MHHLLQDWVTDRAEKSPALPAVAGSGELLTYSQLERLSNRVARVLVESGFTHGDRVCLLLPKTPLAIAAIVGIYKAGCIYVPLDPKSPAPRLTRTVSVCECRGILADSSTAHLASDVLRDSPGTDIRIGWMDRALPSTEAPPPAFTLDDVLTAPANGLNRRQHPSDTAHILFTSGSTGVPKGVVITHANVTSFVEWGVRYFGINASDRMSGHCPLHFDLSVFDIWGTFAAGAQLHLIGDLTDAAHDVVEFIRGRELTQWFSVPAVMHYVAKYDALRSLELPSLKRVMWCGEVLPTPSLIYWMRRLPHAQFTNLYGPTETTIASSYFTVPECPDDEHASIPIGAACDGEELLVLDEDLKLAPIGETGDLHIRGSGLSPGYWRDPEATGQAFLPNPFSADPFDRIYRTGDLARVGADGQIYFAGRKDTQIKSRGYRIELQEIEATLSAVPGLIEAAVVAAHNQSLETCAICCAYVPADRDLSPVALRRILASALPAYMLPVRWQEFTELPKNSNGKIDRRQIREAFERHEAVATQYA